MHCRQSGCARSCNLATQLALPYTAPPCTAHPPLPSLPERLLLPPKFRCDEPQRVCAACAEVLLPVQPLLAGSISPAVKQPVHDVFDL